MKAGKPIVIFGFVVLLCIFSTVWADGLTGKKAPQITIREWITNNPPDVSNLAHRVYVIEFWATWCPSCVKSIPHLNELNNRYRHKGLELISIAQDKSAQTLQRFVRKTGINYHVAIDNGSADWYRIKGYPTIVVVNHLGIVVWEGYPWSSDLEQAIEQAIAAGPPPLVAGVDLGPFENLKKPLWGGRGFTRAYKKIQNAAQSKQPGRQADCAREILQTINHRLAQRIQKADDLRHV
ncbi:MAG: TlpA family protein disulfide reductase, partial [Planctomycetota bacterium]